MYHDSAHEFSKACPFLKLDEAVGRTANEVHPCPMHTSSPGTQYAKIHSI